MKVITEEILRKLIRGHNIDHEHKEIAADLIGSLEEIDTLTVSKLRPMVDAPKDGEIIQVFYSKVFEDAWWSNIRERWQIDEEYFYREELLKGWIPKAIYKPELAGGDGG